jgi:DNA-binding response OmpR family regulator
MKFACYVRDEKMSKRVQYILGNAGFDCELFHSELALLRKLGKTSFDLILVESGCKCPSEERVFSWLNCRTGESTPVVLLSAAHSADRVALALNAGADDFLSTGFDPVELVARVKAILRRSKRHSTQRTIELGGFFLDLDAHSIQYDGEPIDLTQREFTMAWLLFSSVGFDLSRETISVAVWGVSSDIASRTIEQHIYKLRKKLQLSPERGVVIRTSYMKGYRLEQSRKEKSSETADAILPPALSDQSQEESSWTSSFAHPGDYPSQPPYLASRELPELSR